MATDYLADDTKDDARELQHNDYADQWNWVCLQCAALQLRLNATSHPTCFKTFVTEMFKALAIVQLKVYRKVYLGKIIFPAWLVLQTRFTRRQRVIVCLTIS